MSTNILIVTHEQNMIGELRELLTRLGYKIVGIAATNEEIIKKIEEGKPDLILADIRLNGNGGGIKTGHLVRSRYDLPIIYFTGSASETTVQRAKSTGPFGYIFKPFDEKQIYATIETALLRHDLELELREERRWLNTVLDSINEGVIALDDHGIIRFINPIATQLTGWSQVETVGKTLYEVFALIDESSHERLEIAGIKKSINSSSLETRVEGLLLSKYGKTTPIKADITIMQPGNGQASGMVLVFRDITKSREAVQEIRRQSQRAQALVETAARLNAQLELNSVLETVCNISNQALKADATAVLLQDTKKNSFKLMALDTQVMALEKYEDLSTELHKSALESILAEENSVALIDNIQTFPQLTCLELFKEKGIHTIGIAGLYRQHDLIGILILIYFGAKTYQLEDTRILLKALADQAAASITNANLFEQVRDGRERQKALASKLVEIQESERQHIARELHDQVGQVLTGLQFMLESAKNQTSNAYVNKISEAQETVSSLIEQIREMSLNLRPMMLDDFGLLPTLLWHFERYTQQTGIKVLFENHELTERLSPNIETTVYRIVQEALTNVARYAKVAEVSVQLTPQENTLEIEIVDHGIGFDSYVNPSKRSAVGLAGMCERANILGGYAEVRSVPGAGTQIIAVLPLDGQPINRRNRVRSNHIG